jgi:hypothetical protein
MISRNLVSFVGICFSVLVCRGCTSHSPTPRPTDMVGYWTGRINPYAVVKPKIPSGTTQEIMLRSDGSCRVEGFLLNVRSDLPPRIYGGEGSWRIEQESEGWFVEITLPLDGYARSDRLSVIWTGKQWELSLQWDDPDNTNEIQFLK